MQPFALRTPALEPPRDPVPQSGRSVKRSRVETPEKVRGEQDPETRSHIHVLSSTLIHKRSTWGGFLPGYLGGRGSRRAECHTRITSTRRSAARGR